MPTNFNDLALHYQRQGRYGEAEPLFQRSLAIYEKALGPDHLDTATRLTNLAFLYRDQGRYGEAEPLFLRSLAIYEKALGFDHPITATHITNLAFIYRDQGRDREPSRCFDARWRSTKKLSAPITLRWRLFLKILLNYMRPLADILKLLSSAYASKTLERPKVEIAVRLYLNHLTPTGPQKLLLPFALNKLEVVIAAKA